MRPAMSRSVFSLALAGLAVITQLTSAQIDFECPEADGLFAHPEQCDRYFECRNFRVKRKLCADGLVFDPNKVLSEEPCDHQQNTKHKCRGKPNLQPPKPGDRYCPRQNGVFPSPDVTECGRFYSCLNGVGKVQQCADGLYYEEEIGTCDWARTSKRKGCLSESRRAENRQNSNGGSNKRRNNNRPAFKFDDNNQAKISDPLPNGFQCPGGKLGVHPALPHPTSCRLYYVCLNGVTPNEAGCTSGVVFNERTGKCDDPANVPGCENTYEKKSKSRGSQSSSSLRRGNPNSSSSQKKNTADKSDDDIDPEQFARILELLTNPKLKNILRPEIADALEDNLSVLQKTDSFEAQRCVLNQRFCLMEV